METCVFQEDSVKKSRRNREYEKDNVWSMGTRIVFHDRNILCRRLCQISYLLILFKSWQIYETSLFLKRTQYWLEILIGGSANSISKMTKNIDFVPQQYQIELWGLCSLKIVFKAVKPYFLSIELFFIYSLNIPKRKIINIFVVILIISDILGSVLVSLLQPFDKNSTRIVPVFPNCSYSFRLNLFNNLQINYWDITSLYLFFSVFVQHISWLLNYH